MHSLTYELRCLNCDNNCVHPMRLNCFKRRKSKWCHYSGKKGLREGDKISTFREVGKLSEMEKSV